MSYYSTTKSVVFGILVLVGSIGGRLAGADAVAGEEREPLMRIKRMGQRQPVALVEPESNEGGLAMEHMDLAPGFEVSLWAAEPMLANPVAFNFDEHGRIFVAEVHRFSSSVLAITSYLPMLEDDLACRTIDDRLAMLRRNFGEAGLKELSIESDRVRLLEDRNGDGKADHSSVYADDFRAPLDGLGSGVLARRGKVWYANIPSLWLLSGESQAATRTELSRGYGVRYNYAGHDLHGLVFGPDGKIYYSVGDRGAHVTTKEGGVIDVPDTGAVFRCNPDGTQLELYAWGLRNPQSLLFNEYGDLFTGDNDSDQGDEERLVHVVEGGDSGWRIGYQFSPLENGGPLNREKLWLPRHAGQPSYFLAAICNIEDGPSGVAYYPGTGFGEAYRNTLFIAHYKGAVARSGIYSYTLKPDGATYRVVDSQPFVAAALPTDVRFGPDGALYFSDWGLSGWSKSKRGRIYAVGHMAHRHDPVVAETKALITGDWESRSSKELVGLLSHADWRVRLEAQYTLAERGAASASLFAEVATDPGSSAFGRRHAVWGLGQLVAVTAEAIHPLRALIQDLDPEIRAQACKTLGDVRDTFAAEALMTALEDKNERVKFFAAQSLGRLRHAAATAPLLRALRANDDRDVYLRHALVMGLVGANDVQALVSAIADESKAVRLGALLALRRLRHPAVLQLLRDREPDLVREAAIAINDEPIVEAMPALAAIIKQPVSDEAVMLRVLNANFRLGQPVHAAALAAYAVRSDAPASLRAEALVQLSLWPKPPARDRIMGVFRPLTERTRDAGIARSALDGIVSRLLASGTSEIVQTAALSALETLADGPPDESLIALIGDSSQPAATRIAVLELFDKSKSPRLAEGVRLAGQSASPTLRLAALPIASRLSPAIAGPLLATLVSSESIEEQKAAFRALAAMDHPAVRELLMLPLKKLVAGELKPAVQIELREAVQQRKDPALIKILNDHDARLGASEDPLAGFVSALDGGDVRRGRLLFHNHPLLACNRCHRAGPETGGDAGPDLSGIGGKRDRLYLLESIVRPNAHVASGFDMVVTVLNSGTTIAGLLVNEDDVTFSLRDHEGKITIVKKSDVKTRESAPSSMPDIYDEVLTRSELRDLVEYVASLKGRADVPVETPVPRALRGLSDR